MKKQLGDIIGEEIKYRASSKHPVNKAKKRHAKESNKKIYMYYCPQEETLIESPYKHIKSVHMEVRTEDANYLFPWVPEGKLTLAVYAECFYLGEL